MADLIIENEQSQTSITVKCMSANPYHTIAYDWTIDKTVNPDTWNLFKGDTATSQYEINVTKGQEVEKAWITGKICIENTGCSPTEGLAITVSLQRRLPGETTFSQIVPPQTVDTSEDPILYPFQDKPSQPSDYCYVYKIDVPSDKIDLNAIYRVEAIITITNHPGGVSGTQKRATTELPDAVKTNDSISVQDTSVTIPNSSNITDSTTFRYEKTFKCDSDEGVHTNTATIISESPVSVPSAEATVTINCYSLNVTKDVNTEFTRKYTWSIEKMISEDQINYENSADFIINKGESRAAYYRVIVTPEYTDMDYRAFGTIYIKNPAPISATIDNITDTISGVSGDIPVTCETITEFPYLLDAESKISCKYATTQNQIIDKTTRTNKAIVTIINYNYRFDNDINNPPQPIGTTDFEGTQSVIFSSNPSHEIDKCIKINDDLEGFIGTASAPGSETLYYQTILGPYSSCGSIEVLNTATATTVTCPDESSTGTGTTISSAATAKISVSCSDGCTHTIGYWKTHAGFTGNNPDEVTPLLGTGIWLGIPNEGKSNLVTNATEAYDLFNFLGNPSNTGGASNGINKLYAQLLAARLNEADGADISTIVSVLANADNQLSLYNSSDWNELSGMEKSYINQLTTTLDNYNNGLIGPPHCSEDDVPIEPIPPTEDDTEDNCCNVINIIINNSGTLKIFYNYREENDEQ